MADYFRQGDSVLKKCLHIFCEYGSITVDMKKAMIGLPCIGLRFQRERDGGIRFRAVPGLLPGASA